MATLKFTKNASRIVLKNMPDLLMPTSNELIHLKDEVRFLKDILRIKRFGGGYSELVYKFKELQNENERLRSKKEEGELPEIRFKKLVNQNQRLKTELANYREMSEGDLNSRKGFPDRLAMTASKNIRSEYMDSSKNERYLISGFNKSLKKAEQKSQLFGDSLEGGFVGTRKGGGLPLKSDSSMDDNYDKKKVIDYTIPTIDNKDIDFNKEPNLFQRKGLRVSQEDDSGFEGFRKLSNQDEGIELQGVPQIERRSANLYSDNPSEVRTSQLKSAEEDDRSSWFQGGMNSLVLNKSSKFSGKANVKFSNRMDLEGFHQQRLIPETMYLMEDHIEKKSLKNNLSSSRMKTSPKLSDLNKKKALNNVLKGFPSLRNDHSLLQSSNHIKINQIRPRGNSGSPVKAQTFAKLFEYFSEPNQKSASPKKMKNTEKQESVNQRHRLKDTGHLFEFISNKRLPTSNSSISPYRSSLPNGVVLGKIETNMREMKRELSKLNFV